MLKISNWLLKNLAAANEITFWRFLLPGFGQEFIPVWSLPKWGGGIRGMYKITKSSHRTVHCTVCVYLSHCTVQLCVFIWMKLPIAPILLHNGILLFSALIISMLQLLILYFSIFWYFLFKSPFPPQASEKSRFLFLGNLKPVQITQLTEVIFGFSFWLPWILVSLLRSLRWIFFVRPPPPLPPSPTCARSANINKSKSLCRLCAHKSAQKGFYRDFNVEENNIVSHKLYTPSKLCKFIQIWLPIS